MTKLERQLKKYKKLVDKKLQENNRKVVVCKDCGQLIDIEHEKAVVEYDMLSQNLTYLCERCNEKFIKEMEQRKLS